MNRGLFLIAFFCMFCNPADADFSRLEGLAESGIKRVVFSRLDGHVLYTASGNAVFKVNVSSG